ncbi:polysaccharide deacetylase family protein [Simiduia curdlanivorans]|uniref:Polysaccharide deacetylase family protein n=1 Tax=Simiduia curdlanivorans TaxID=1492769 RepID=A0ABV8V3J1_9GAMM|nr:polysaccharide deacetylase family protein [Simiduia curdlanivorans]MDN3638203.1 polysaccharide deacetylase family protein [Simiduia curdlanivorans]
MYSGYQCGKWALGRRILCLAALFILAPSAHSLVILQYHHVSTETPAATSISPAGFKAHLEQIERSGYRVVALPEVLQALRQRAPLPDKAVLISFDDGSKSVLTAALPLLKAKRWPFVVFVSTEPVTQQQTNTLSWDDLRALADQGAAIANHGVSHSHMIRRLDGETQAQWRARMEVEILAAEAKIEAETGQSHRAFAYPYGEFSAALVALVEELGFVGFGQHSGAPAPRDIAALPRFPFGGNYVEVEDLALKLRSLALPFDRVVYLGEEGAGLADGVLAPTEGRPIVQYVAENLAQFPDLACYVSRQGAADKLATSATKVSFQAQKVLKPGRTRYNCTAKSGEPGRYYWHSSPFIKPNADGSWAPEPN